jgi:hypothetical protein
MPFFGSGDFGEEDVFLLGQWPDREGAFLPIRDIVVEQDRLGPEERRSDGSEHPASIALDPETMRKNDDVLTRKIHKVLSLWDEVGTILGESRCILQGISYRILGAHQPDVPCIQAEPSDA